MFCREEAVIAAALSDEASQPLEGTIGLSLSTSTSPWVVPGEFMSTRHTCLDSGRGVTCTFWVITCLRSAGRARRTVLKLDFFFPLIFQGRGLFGQWNWRGLTVSTEPVNTGKVAFNRRGSLHCRKAPPQQ